MDNWNRDDWQGRTREQVEDSYRGCGWMIILILIILIIGSIIMQFLI